MRVESREGGGGAPPKRNWFKLLIAESMSLPQSWRTFSRRWWRREANGRRGRGTTDPLLTPINNNAMIG